LQLTTLTFDPKYSQLKGRVKGPSFVTTSIFQHALLMSERPFSQVQPSSFSQLAQSECWMP
jgi:hypothetical protein